MTMASDQKQDQPNRWTTTIIMVALGLATFLASLDSVLIATALPRIASQFQFSESAYAWVGSSYLLTTSAGLPLWGKMADVYGTKITIQIANAIFFIGSCISGASKGWASLVCGRSLQGFGGGGIIVLVQICISHLFDLRYARYQTNYSTYPC
jgi:MFS family permease